MIESSAQIFIPYESFILVLPKRRMASGGRPLLPEILDQTGPGSENADFQSIFARSAAALTSSEKSSINTNRKSTTRFPMSLR